ncbi:MAG: Glu/Leu/Phe/Val dehydrogenase dimerization domain-containing protein [Candidatus Dormibacteraceae bacterium]
MSEPFLRATWTDPVTNRRGHIVIDRLIDGLAGGGTRVREGCTLEEVERLAQAMTLKNGGQDIPVGGAKCGVDIDPHDPDAYPLLVRFARAMRPLFETYVVTGEDLGTTAEELFRVFAEAGLKTPFQPALRRYSDPEAQGHRISEAFAAGIDGIDLFDLVGGFGVAEAADAALAHLGLDPVGSRAAVQGFGSMGGSAARYLAVKGVLVVLIADAGGCIFNPGGLDVEHYLAARNRLGEIDRAALAPGDSELPRDEWLAQGAEILIPAAVADTIHEGNCDRITARLIVEAANIPTTAGAEQALAGRGVLVVPDFIANAGTNSWAWWVVLGLVAPGPDAAFDRIRESMHRTVISMLELADSENLTPREAAVRVAMENSDRNRDRLPS